MKIVVIGVSAGGPETLKRLFQEVKILKVPVIIAQHNAAEDVESFAKSFSAQIKWNVQVVKDKDLVTPSTIYMPAGGKDITLAGKDVVIVQNPVGIVAPSIDRLFKSAAKLFRSEAVAIILSGLGRDGVEGAMGISKAGGRVIVQQDAKFSRLPEVVAENVFNALKRSLIDIAMFLENLE
ncbi:MAG: chemotaxis protein CheB [Thermotogaceae bacterium]|nr:chemotaxis protein CheB [Thermotogaceae bacterium]